MANTVLPCDAFFAVSGKEAMMSRRFRRDAAAQITGRD